MERIREAQRREIIDLDKNISRQAFRKAFEVVQAYKDIYKPPNKMEKTIAYEIEKFLIDMEGILTEIQASLENELSPLQDKILEQAIKSPIVPPEQKNPEESQEEIEEKGENEGSGRCSYKKGGRIMLSGGIRRDISTNLLSVWNRFINYLDKIVNLGTFTQNDFNVLYDRLDDLVPVLQNIQILNRDAETVGVSPINKSTIDIILQKIVNKDLSSVIPSKDFGEFSPNETKMRLEEQLKNLKSLDGKLLPRKFIPEFSEKKRMYRDLIKRTKNPQDKARYEAEQKLFLERGANTARFNLAQEDVRNQINRIQKILRTSSFEPRTKFSRQARIRGTGKTAVANIINNMGNDIYNLYEAIPEMSYDDLKKLYIEMFQKRQFAQENNDEENFNKSNFVITRILADPRAKELEAIMGKGRETNTTLRYGSNQPLYFDDDRNWAYAR